MKLYQGVVKPEVKGPPGRMPQLLHTDDEAGTVASVLDDLCGPENVRPQDVVVLSAHPSCSPNSVAHTPWWTSARPRPS